MALRDDMNKKKTSAGGLHSKAAQIQKLEKQKKQRFIWVHMWINYLLSFFMKDRGKIPENIGDRIVITNNTYITKLYMSTIIHVYELGPYTPITLMEVLIDQLRSHGNTAILDMSCKNEEYVFDPKNSGLRSRIRAWTNNLHSDATTRRMRERSARLLYTVDVAQSGKQLKKSRIFLTLRSDKIDVLNSAERIIYDALGLMGCVYMPAHSNIKENLSYIALLSNRALDRKGLTAVMTTNTVLSQLVPNCGTVNDKKGIFVGMNISNGSPYYIDFSSITIARNMYVVAPSGVGKTVLALNMAESAYENGSAVCFTDIKGNEFTNFINATNGYIVSLRPDSTEFINSWIMHYDDVEDDQAEFYFKSRIQFSKQQIIILSGIKERERLLELEELLDEFHESLYVTIGASPLNRNSWSVTEQLNPSVVFDKLKKYLTPAKMEQYHLNKIFIGTLSMYMSSTGSKNYVFKTEFDYAKILNSNTLSFDFGLLKAKTVSDVDVDLFRLKFLYMSKLNEEFTTKKYDMGKRTFKVLEESQIVSPEIMEMYVQEYTLRRSQNQETLLLGNSVQALYDNALSRALIENTTGIFIGQLTLDARKIVIEQFGLKEIESLINLPGSSVEYKNSFLFVNKMEDKSKYPIIKVIVEKDDNGDYVRYKINTPVKSSV